MRPGIQGLCVLERKLALDTDNGTLGFRVHGVVVSYHLTAFLA